ncbi:dimethyl sulfoxide reductase anchor subunit [Cereibacter azotoformans]|uniref:DMSO reductase anchor subunit n=1 Tax=Cereibacter azotoformans TaxID=43057 RepID=A0A2T5JT38_9RHOB|nr:DmsC/YnfH family molybdoenzyme membrane anchor subunit [Cereibacter azotoformans]AXQ95728.1 DMSO reductase [Cereibacter sphaeroides]PTR12976.1 DMSO reductase anchor subunit [Cereibacter azotoformans]UIJ32772.1 dimethyl sulfoxide reductase anchor subunit [Cereibacter azotoformans]
MRPAPSLLLFTVLSGAGFGTLALAALGGATPTVWAAGHALVLAGLVASTFHLAHPLRARFAFSRLRTSWLSREAWGAVAALALLVPVAVTDLAGGLRPASWGIPGAFACLGTVISTAMIYGQLRAVPRWHHWTTPALFLGFAAAGGAVIAVPGPSAAALCVALSAGLAASFVFGDRRMARLSLTLEHATGLARFSRVRSFEQPSTGPTWLTREIVDGRPRLRALRWLAVLLAGVVPAAVLILAPGAVPLAAALHLAGAVVARWLFFAEARHVAGLYHGVPLAPKDPSEPATSAKD